MKLKKISDAMTGENNPNSSKIEVTDLKEITTNSYNSFSEAARALNLPSHNVISNYIIVIKWSLIKVDILSRRYS